MEGLLKRAAASIALAFAPRGRSPQGTPRSILVVRQHDQLGDMICAIPLIRALGRRYPGAAIDLVASPVNAAIMEHSPYLRDVILYDKRALLRRPPSAGRFIHALRSRAYDIAIVPATVSLSATSDILASLSGATERIGAASLDGRPNPSSELFTAAVPLDWRGTPRRHQTLRHIDAAAPLGLGDESGACTIGLTAGEILAARTALGPPDERRPLVCIHPGAGKPPNRWPAERFAALARALRGRKGARIVFTAGPMDDGPIAATTAGLDFPYEVVRGRPLREIAALLHSADLVVTNDTGIMHVAGGVARSVLSLFGPTDPLQWAPLGEGREWLAAPDGTMGSLSMEEVFFRCEALLDQGNPQG